MLHAHLTTAEHSCALASASQVGNALVRLLLLLAPALHPFPMDAPRTELLACP